MILIFSYSLDSSLFRFLVCYFTHEISWFSVNFFFGFVLRLFVCFHFILFFSFFSPHFYIFTRVVFDYEQLHVSVSLIFVLFTTYSTSIYNIIWWTIKWFVCKCNVFSLDFDIISVRVYCIDVSMGLLWKVWGSIENHIIIHAAIFLHMCHAFYFTFNECDGWNAFYNFVACIIIVSFSNFISFFFFFNFFVCQTPILCLISISMWSYMHIFTCVCVCGGAVYIKSYWISKQIWLPDCCSHTLTFTCIIISIKSKNLCW